MGARFFSVRWDDGHGSGGDWKKPKPPENATPQKTQNRPDTFIDTIIPPNASTEASTTPVAPYMLS